MGFLEDLDAVIERPCQWCKKTIPESSPSDDFCRETCERAWQAEQIGGKFEPSPFHSYSAGEVVVPEDHPATPTHRSEQPDFESGFGLMQFLTPEAFAAAYQRGEERRREAYNLFMGNEFRVMPRIAPLPGQAYILNGHGGGWQAHATVTHARIHMDGRIETFLSVDPVWSVRPPANDASRVMDLVRYSEGIVRRRREMTEQARWIAEAFALPAHMLGDIPHFDDRSHIIYPQRTARQRWAEQCRDDGFVILEVLDAVIDFVIYRAPEAVAAAFRRVRRFVTRQAE